MTVISRQCETVRSALRKSLFRTFKRSLPPHRKGCAAARKSLFRTTDSCRRHVRVAETDAEKAFPRAAEEFSTQRRFYFTDLFCRVFFTMKMYIYAFYDINKNPPANIIQINPNSALCASVRWRQPVETQNLASHVQPCRF